MLSQPLAKTMLVNMHGDNATIHLARQEEFLKKPKLVLQVFAEGLKLARLRMAGVLGHYVTPEELGEMLNPPMTGQTIRNYEAGKNEPTMEIISQLMAATQTEPAWPPFSNVPGVVIERGNEEDRNGTAKKRRRAR